MQGWEQLVLSRLRWDIAAVTPNDFVEPLLRRLTKFTLIAEHQNLIRRHVLSMIDLCAAGKCALVCPLPSALGIFLSLAQDFPLFATNLTNCIRLCARLSGSVCACVLDTVPVVARLFDGSRIMGNGFRAPDSLTWTHYHFPLWCMRVDEICI